MQTVTSMRSSVSDPANGNSNDQAERRRTLEDAFATALSAGGVIPHYQPVVSLASGNIAGWKSLARWNHPTRGLIGPGLFMHVFDNNDICMRLGEVMSNAVCADMADWAAQGLSFCRVGLTLSRADLEKPDFADTILANLKAQNIAPRHLVLRVAQKALVDFSTLDQFGQLRSLKEAGCLVAVDVVDDYNLGTLNGFACDIIEIGQKLTSNIITSATDRARVEALVGFAAANGCATVAEGIESRTQQDLLRALGCDRGNGYLFGRPQTPAEAAGSMVTLYNRSA